MDRKLLLAFATAALLVAACADGRDPLALAVGESTLAKSPAPDPAAALKLPAPVFGLATSPDGSLLAATVLSGVSEIRQGTTRLVAALPGVSDVAAVGRGNLLAITGEPADFDAPDPNSRKVFRISQGNTREIADLWAFEVAVNPDQIWNDGPLDSNPFSIVALNGGRALVADAGGNSILVVDEKGSVDWVAVLTPQLASTAPFKALLGCTVDDPRPPCGLPAQIPAEPVATSVAVGPDGAYYAGELTGFPGTPGLSRVWRIEADSRHVLCPSAACTLVADGFTSIMDLAFGPDGTLYVVELDAAGWLAAILPGFPMFPVAGGRVQACNVATGSCVVRASELSLPTAVTVGKDGTVWVAENDAIDTAPGSTSRIGALP
jgi:hypothetical protein